MLFKDPTLYPSMYFNVHGGGGHSSFTIEKATELVHLGRGGARVKPNEIRYLLPEIQSIFSIIFYSYCFFPLIELISEELNSTFFIILLKMIIFQSNLNKDSKLQKRKFD